MYAIDVQQPKTLDAAAAALKSSGGRPLAGGQSLIAAMKLRLSQPGHARRPCRDPRPQGRAQGRQPARHRCDDAACRRCRVRRRQRARCPRWPRSPKASATGKCGTWARSAARSPTTILPPTGRLRCSVAAQRCARTRAPLLPTISSRACSRRRWHPTKSSRPSNFRCPRARRMRNFPNPASRFALVGVFVAQAGNGDVRVAVTGAASSVFRATAIEAALRKSFTPDAAKATRVDASGLNNDLHGSAEYRAHLVSVMAARAVAACAGA